MAAVTTTLVRLPPKTVYASGDIEADGPNPCQNSMRGLGISLRDAFGNELDALAIPIKPRADRKEDPATMTEFWAKHPEAWKWCNTGAVSVSAAMDSLATRIKLWLASYARVVWACKPASYDWMWLKCNYDEFAPPGAVKLPFKCDICISTMFDTCCDMWGVPPDKDIRNAFQKELSGQSLGQELSHTPLDDARVQGRLLTSLQFKISAQLVPQYSTFEKRMATALVIPKDEPFSDSDVDDDDSGFDTDDEEELLGILFGGDAGEHSQLLVSNKTLGSAATISDQQHADVSDKTMSKTSIAPPTLLAATSQALTSTSTSTINLKRKLDNEGRDENPCKAARTET